MRYSISLTLTAFLMLALSACSGVETHSGEVDTFTAGNYKYYSWRSEPMANTANSMDTMYRLDPLLRGAINQTLQAKGYRLSKKQAQFTVDYIFVEGVRDGVVGSEADNLTTQPGVVPNRTLDQASIDNAYALGALKETRNIGIQFNDVETQKEVWRVTITKLVNDVNATKTPNSHHAINSVIDKSMRVLPNAQ